MDKEIKKKIASNWFKLLQNTICNDIEKLENHKLKFKSKMWKRNQIKDEGGINTLSRSGLSLLFIFAN